MPRCIRVPKEKGESVRTKLADLGLLDTGYRISSDGTHLTIPVLCDSFEDYEVSEVYAEPLEEKISDYKMILDFPDWLNEELPHSYDVIGDVAIIKLTEVLLPYREEIGNALLEAVPSLRIVMADSGVKGEFRVRELEKIAGTGDSETVHKEFGVRIFTDPSKVYFNPRLANERSRVASLVRDGETIIDMFAGTAPFPLVICKLAHPGEVYAVDLNPEAEKFMKKNIEANRAKIIPIIGDAREEVKKLPKADRIIMNLPQISEEFLTDALGAAKTGATIHLYKVLERSDIGNYSENLVTLARDSGFDIHIARAQELKTYSPTMSVYAFDLVKD